MQINYVYINYVYEIKMTAITIQLSIANLKSKREIERQMNSKIYDE